MMHAVKSILSLLLLSGMTHVTLASQPKIEVFTTQFNHVSQCHEENNCTTYFLDLEARLLDEVFPNLPDDETKAYQQVMAVINSPAWADYEAQFKVAQMPILRAWELGVTKYPAIVINDKFVAYGATDVDVALADYEHYRQERQE